MSDEPQTADGKRILGVVPATPPVGDRKVPAERDQVMVWPHLLVRHAVVALAVLAVVLLLALFVDAPLREVANPNRTPNPEKAPWYFVGLQELLSRFHPMVAGVLVPGAIVVGLVALPFVDRNPRRDVPSRKVAVLTFSIFLGLFIVLTVVGFAFRGPDWTWVLPWRDGWYGEL